MPSLVGPRPRLPPRPYLVSYQRAPKPKIILRLKCAVLSTPIHREAGAYTRSLFAQLERFLWDRGCFQGMCRGHLWGVREYHGCLWCILCQKRLS